jgi:hypothetical protein
MTTTFKFGLKSKLVIVLAALLMRSAREAMTIRMFLSQAPAIEGLRS